MTEVYLTIDKETFELTKEEAKKRYLEDNDDIENIHFKYGDCSITDESIDYKDGQFEVYGDLIDNLSGKNLGYISLTLRPDMDLVIDLIEYYMKKLGKLKTVLEATK